MTRHFQLAHHRQLHISNRYRRPNPYNRINDSLRRRRPRPISLRLPQQRPPRPQILNIPSPILSPDIHPVPNLRRDRLSNHNINSRNLMTPTIAFLRRQRLNTKVKSFTTRSSTRSNQPTTRIRRPNRLNSIASFTSPAINIRYQNPSLLQSRISNITSLLNSHRARTMLRTTTASPILLNGPIRRLIQYTHTIKTSRRLLTIHTKSLHSHINRSLSIINNNIQTNVTDTRLNNRRLAHIITPRPR